MALVIQERGRSLDYSASDDHHDVNTQPFVGRFNERWHLRFINVAARLTIQIMMIIAMLKSSRSQVAAIRNGMAFLIHQRRRS